MQDTLCACKVNHRSNRTAFPLPAKAGSIHAGEYSMKNVVTREFLKKHGACYYNEEGGEEKVNALVPDEGLTALQVARLKISEQDRIWVLTREGVLADSALWEWAARTVERALSRAKTPDPRSLAVVPLLRRLASGEKVSRSEIEKIRADAASAAASAAVYAAAAYAAAAYAADAYAYADAARISMQKKTAEIVRKHYPVAPTL